MANTVFCGVEADADDLFCGVAAGNGDLFCGVAAALGGLIEVEWESSTTWDDIPVSGHRGFVTTGMEVGDVITVYYRIIYYPEAVYGTTTANGKIRENLSSWALECSFSGNSGSSSNESHAGIDYDDAVDVQCNASSGHPEDSSSVGAEIYSVTVTSGGKDAEVGSRDYWEEVNTGLIE